MCSNWSGNVLNEIVAIDGLDRSYEVYLPQTACEEETPIVFWFHCWGCTANYPLYLQTYWEKLAEAQNNSFILVKGQGFEKSWNSPGCCGEALRTNKPDLCFVQSMIVELLKKQINIDLSSIYFSGHSNGGYFSSYGTLFGLKFVRGFVSISGHIDETPLNLKKDDYRYVSIHHGDADTCVSMMGCCQTNDCRCIDSSGEICYTIPEHFQFWLDQNSCTGGMEVYLDDENRECLMGKNCKAPTSFCKYKGQNHHLVNSPASEIIESILADVKNKAKSETKLRFEDLMDSSICTESLIQEQKAFLIFGNKAPLKNEGGGDYHDGIINNGIETHHKSNTIMREVFLITMGIMFCLIICFWKKLRLCHEQFYMGPMYRKIQKEDEEEYGLVLEDDSSVANMMGRKEDENLISSTLPASLENLDLTTLDNVDIELTASQRNIPS